MAALCSSPPSAGRLHAGCKTSPLASFVLRESGLGSDSYRKAHEIVNHVRKEFEFQGCQLQGPAADLLKAGASGRHLNNVKRDWFRKMGDMNYDHRAPIQWVNVPLWDYGEDGWDDSPQLLGIRRLTYVHYLVYFL
ncbi:unnamed protein product [Cladocopium goreaui]|uniref:Uncharacterized protein n=1 Tax=Cladocopium goreaui TaxID=2562237 RepID=A0A9P1M5H9_9DINO|nr:unnamed protein product [Cladocopium goreaui]